MRPKKLKPSSKDNKEAMKQYDCLLKSTDPLKHNSPSLHLHPKKKKEKRTSWHRPMAN